MEDDKTKKKPAFEMPPPPKPLSFEMPKPPVLQPNVAAILKKTNNGKTENVVKPNANLPFNPPVPPVFNPTPNPFAPRPKSVSPNPSSLSKSENDEIPKTATGDTDVTPNAVNSENKSPATTEDSGRKLDKKVVQETIEPALNAPAKSEKPTTLNTTAPTTEIPITPMVEETKNITSPATVEVSNHTENVKSVGTDSSNVFTDKIDMSGGLMSWLTKTVTESKLLSDVAEKAKAGVETVMTTLDPGMKPFLAEHGVIEFALFNCDADVLTVASDAFTRSGAMAICRGLSFDETAVIFNFRPLVNGEQNARKLCEVKIEAARKTKKAKEDAAVVVTQPFLLKIGGRYYYTCKVMLNHGSTYFDAISQLLEVPETIVEAIQRSAKSEGLPDDEFSISVTQAIKNIYKTSVSTWEPGCLAPYDSKELLSVAFSSVSQQLLRNLAPVN
ncbi:hypothetical protein GCK72_005948 [Caenorhabditis remanei]|uniref:Uncharacterized protein n=1 Tax=Caenorhabditis remanei TaxID=31234 RepID=A0A6A5HH33_CAERE|nr:hypothetical protein GCK72_005948 [Caenorhabditis remanei]KAF1765994.1 hypothetical protein GCK72_005948 [Caenorhabditis remanei]